MRRIIFYKTIVILSKSNSINEFVSRKGINISILSSKSFVNLSFRKFPATINTSLYGILFIVIFKSICVFNEELAIKWLHTLIGKTQLFMRTGI